jgi:hypothetical protein
MYFLIYSAHPNKGTEAHSKYSGADIACWIKTNNRESARLRSRRLIEGRNWTIDRLEEEHPMSRKMAESSKGLQYYEQALVDGEVLVFFTSPL